MLQMQKQLLRSQNKFLNAFIPASQKREIEKELQRLSNLRSKRTQVFISKNRKKPKKTFQTQLDVNEISQQTDFDAEYREMACGSANVNTKDSLQSGSEHTKTTTSTAVNALINN